MSSGGYLSPPSETEPQTPQQKQLWTETSTRLERFLPGMMAELFPEEEKKPTENSKVESEALPVREKADGEAEAATAAAAAATGGEEKPVAES